MIYGVSLGPGDPDLITVKGLKILEAVDKIYYPGSLFKNGVNSSYSQSILAHYNLPEAKCFGFYLEMSLARTQAKEIYDTAFHQIQEDYKNGLTVAIVSEGDINTFSSFSYLLEKIKTHNLEVTLVPGITSYGLGAAIHKKPLCLQNEKVMVLPRVASKEILEEALTYCDTVVLMKIYNVIDVIDAVVKSNTYQLFYSERLGTNQEFVSSNWEEIKAREIPYFSLITIKK